MRRPYDSPVRRQRAAATREKIVAAGAEVLHELPTWNWGALTARAAAARAGVNERTVYRHFATERHLRDAVLARLREEAGVDLSSLTLGDVGPVTARIFDFVSTFPLQARSVRDPTVAAENERQREALAAAVAPHTAGWDDTDRTIAAAVLDVLWSVVSYERLVTDWQLDPKDATRGIGWVISLVEAAILAGEPPTT